MLEPGPQQSHPCPNADLRDQLPGHATSPVPERRQSPATTRCYSTTLTVIAEQDTTETVGTGKGHDD